MAHARRYFEKALGNHKEAAEYVLQEIQKLYQIERRCREKRCSWPKGYITNTYTLLSKNKGGIWGVNFRDNIGPGQSLTLKK
jgi:hypothetical protein